MNLLSLDQTWNSAFSSLYCTRFNIFYPFYTPICSYYFLYLSYYNNVTPNYHVVVRTAPLSMPPYHVSSPDQLHQINGYIFGTYAKLLAPSPLSISKFLFSHHSSQFSLHRFTSLSTRNSIPKLSGLLEGLLVDMYRDI